jgi:hypothetical protein
MFLMQMVTSFAHFVAGRDAEASSWAAKSLREQPNFLASLRLSAASNALSGHVDEAKKSVVRARHLDPDLRISNLQDRVGPFRSQDLAKYAEGLRLAGLPE